MPSALQTEARVVQAVSELETRHLPVTGTRNKSSKDKTVQRAFMTQARWASCLLTLHCTWAEESVLVLNDWGILKVETTENSQSGRWEHWWKSQADSWPEWSLTLWSPWTRMPLPSHLSYSMKEIILSLIPAEGGQCLPNDVELTLNKLGKIFHMQCNKLSS